MQLLKLLHLHLLQLHLLLDLRMWNLHLHLLLHLLHLLHLDHSLPRLSRLPRLPRWPMLHRWVHPWHLWMLLAVASCMCRSSCCRHRVGQGHRKQVTLPRLRWLLR